MSDKIVLIHHNKFSSDEYYASADGRFTVKRESGCMEDRERKCWVLRDRLAWLEKDFDTYRNDLFERNNLTVVN